VIEKAGGSQGIYSEEVVLETAGGSNAVACPLDPDVASKFTILTCCSPACQSARKKLQMDEYATFSIFYERIAEKAQSVKIEESPCFGSCKNLQNLPAVGVAHEDYIGRVSLLGMSEAEFSDRAFHSVVSEDDADRVWSAIENSIRLMMEGDQGEAEED